MNWKEREIYPDVAHVFHHAILNVESIAGIEFNAGRAVRSKGAVSKKPAESQTPQRNLSV
jgi:hypothetical protein